MSTDNNETTVERRQVSKVSFSPISSELMVVRIRKSEVREEEIPAMSSPLKATPPQKHTKKRKDKSNNSRSTMTDSRNTASTSSQTAADDEKVVLKLGGAKNEHTPCMRHAAENISRKAIQEPVSGGISMCNNCSKSMLSYIFLVQDFLDSLAVKIRGEEVSGCLQCAREEARNSVAMAQDVSSSGSAHSKHNQTSSESRRKDVSSSAHVGKQASRTKAHRSEEHRRHDDYHKDSAHHQHHLHHQHSNQQHNRQTDSSKHSFQDNSSPHSVSNEQRVVSGKPNFESHGQEHNIEHNYPSHQWTGSGVNNNAHQNQSNQNEVYNNNNNIVKATGESFKETAAPSVDHHTPVHSPQESGHSHHREEPSYDRPIYRAPMERRQPVYETPGPDVQQKESAAFQAQSPSLYREDVDGIISTLSNVEREMYESARSKAGWEGFTEPQEGFALPPSSNLIASEAFVTSCRNNAEAIGCLVVGTSLLLCRCSRTLCVLVSDGVSTAFRNALSAVFQVVQFTRSLDSLGTTKLALLEQPELGISFEKLNIWRLTQFTKCVYLNPDTLVIQNCDELFGREELSAVPDIGWPDCFNSGVFVFSPNIDTFWKLMEFAEKQGSYDGGDQGLLNSYFASWSTDISKKLSFTYNLMANVSYTYTPAFKQFGRDVKIVQFHGSFKPWHVKFFSKTGQISPSSPVHPTYVQFVHIWISIFRISVLRILPKNIQSYAASEETICAVETLRFFPLPTESEADFFLTPPSVRLRRAEIRLNRSTNLPLSEAAARRKSAEYLRYIPPPEEEEILQEQKQILQGSDDRVTPAVDSTTTGGVEQPQENPTVAESSEAGEVFEDPKVTKKKVVRDKNAIPGSDVGDYQGMKAWEQGRMDYQGSDSSDNVIKRLEFLMSRSK